MRVSIWQQFSSNNSSNFTVVGVFETPEAAQKAADEVRKIIAELNAWYETHPEEANEILSWGGETPSPAEVAMGKRFGFEWPYAVEWYWSASVQVVLDRLVYITTENFRPDTAGEPFDKILSGLGGQGLLDGNAYGDQISTILVDITCLAPDEDTARSIAKAKLEYCCMVRHKGRHLHFYDWTFSEMDLPYMLNYLEQEGCTDIQYTLSVVEGNRKLPEVSDIDLLIHLLRQPKTIEKDEIAQRLGELGDSRAVDVLADTLNSDLSTFTRLTAAWALGAIGDSSVIAPLIAALSDQQELTRSAAIRTLEKLNIPLPKEPLLKALSDSYSFVRLYAAMILGRLGESAALDTLVALLADYEVWRAASTALASIGEPVQQSVQALLNSADPNLQHRATETLKLLEKFKSFGSAFAALHDYTTDAEQTRLLEEIQQDARAVDILLELLHHPPSNDVQRKAHRILTEFEDARIIPAIVKHLFQLGSAGFEALERFGTQTTQILIDIARNAAPNDSWLKDGAVRCLVQIADPRAVDLLLEVLQNPDWSRYAKQDATLGLRAMKDKRAIDRLIKIFLNPQERYPSYDEWILEALRDLDGLSGLVDPLIEALHKDNSQFMTERTIAALGEIGDSRAIKPLENMLISAEPPVRQVLLNTLQKLQGQ